MTPFIKIGPPANVTVFENELASITAEDLKKHVAGMSRRTLRRVFAEGLTLMKAAGLKFGGRTRPVADETRDRHQRSVRGARPRRLVSRHHVDGAPAARIVHRRGRRDRPEGGLA